MLIPRLLIAGTHSGVGKTTLATGVMAALANQGYRVQGFKVGPDYIDPGYHALATGRAPRNLDVWLLGEDQVARQFVRGAQGADLAIVEGVMGLFDGIQATRGVGSSAHVARLLRLPVILVIDGSGQARSAAALVHGFATFDPTIDLVGVIINQTRSRAHCQGLKTAIEEEVGLPVLGTVPLDQELNLAERHLGLIPAVERGCRGEDNRAYIKHLGQMVSEHLALDQLVALAEAAPALDLGPSEELPVTPCFNVSLAVARDESFHFYYQDALETLETLGARLVEFSPLKDEVLPAGVDGLYIGGGFPEMFIVELTRNVRLMESIRRFWAMGKPIYAECGGLMYLCERIIDLNGDTHAGVGLVPAISRMTERLAGLGYREGRLLRSTVIGEPGTVVRGHEFHYSVVDYHDQSPAYQLYTATGEKRSVEGYAKGHLLASYLHLNFAGNPQLADNFLRWCAAGPAGT
ncbi:MAG: cobyrinate a,c-diamide synthase [Firmicutes bacterium]|nr:cobyrinate a,c-diamide synthase [Bacillota bacterium]